MSQRAEAMEIILTDGDQLADYAHRFFTEVEPVEEDDQYSYDQYGQPMQEGAQDYDQASFERQMAERMYGGNQLPAVPATAGQGTQPMDPQLQWQQFDRIANEDPANAWRVLQNMTPEAFRSKMLFMDAY